MGEKTQGILGSHIENICVCVCDCECLQVSGDDCLMHVFVYETISFDLKWEKCDFTSEHVGICICKVDRST